VISTLLKKHNFNTVYDSQKIFRLILEAISNPSRIVNIGEHANKLYGDYPVLLAVAMTLLDNEVSFSCEDRSLSDEIASLTLAKREKTESADFVFVLKSDEIKNVIESVKYGTLTDPHKSATVIILNDVEATLQLMFSGPGVDGREAARATETAMAAIALRDEQNYEYPQGIDLIFVSSSGELFAVPRLTRVEAE